MTHYAVAAAMTFLLAISGLAAEPCPASFSVGTSDVFDIAVDETDVYFTAKDKVWRVARSGGSPVPFAYLKDHVFMMLAVDEARVYVNVRNPAKRVDSIIAMAKSGGPATELLNGFTASAMLPDGEWLYLLDLGTFARGMSNGDGAAVRVKKDGSKWEKLTTGLHMPMGMIVDGENLYVSERGAGSSGANGGVKRLPKQGGRATSVAKLPFAMAMAQDASNLYIATLGPRHEGSIYSLSKSDGTKRELVRGIRFELILPLEVFDRTLYFGTAVSERMARLEALALGDGARRTVAEFEGGSPFIAVDRCGVYYSTSTGIQRLTP